uniref:Cytochrome c domain-containing protein n=1 Tax=Rhodopseudomonas palustris (strain BisA53) TaxID=316055 RepID=Q07SQ9_RHOP5
MSYRWFVTSLLAIATSASVALAQPDGPIVSSNGQRLADLMEGAQSRHIKLWFAGRARNWDLAAYETGQIKARLEEAAALYPRLPIGDLSTMVGPLDTMAQAVQAKDGARFASAFDEMTRACNACHQVNNRGFIAIKRPTAPAFSNQVFEPGKK